MKSGANFDDGIHIRQIQEGDYKPLLNIIETSDRGYARRWCIKPEIIPEMIAAFKANRVSRMLLGSRVYFPSHVKFSRSRFRHYAKNRASVTQKLELATMMVVDFFFFLKVASQTDHYGYKKPLNNCFHVEQISTGKDFYVNEKDYESLRYQTDFQLIERLVVLNDHSQQNLKALDELITQHQERPDIPIITYDWLNNRACQQTVDSMPTILNMLKLIKNGQDKAQIRIGLNFMASMDPRKYDMLLWMMVSQCYSFDYTKRSAFKTTMHYNVMYRNAVKMGKIHFGTITLSNALRTGVRAGTVEARFAYMIQQYIIAFINKNVERVKPLPLFVSKWWLRWQLKEYMSKDPVVNICVFRDSTAKAWAIETRLEALGKHFWGKGAVGIRQNDPDGHYRVVSQLLGLNFKYLLRYLIKMNDEQTQPGSGPQVGEGLCRQAEINLPTYRDQSK